MGRLRNYLRVQRRKWHLTQEELAFLLGYLNQVMVARLEGEERAITLTVAHACELIFGVTSSDLFPTLLEDVETRVLARMHELRDRLKQSAPSQKALAKLVVLEQAIARITALQENEV
ncbi:MAG TPA: helix-turn-helix transcriptional regulator [Xanthobacteraceae bacterium]|nr:helix-turn-helix transcriptional regulator [Xanthobacteraceae bacterium]